MAEERKDTLEFSRGGSISLVGEISIAGLTFLFSLLAARLFGAYHYGLFVLALSVVEVACMLIVLGLDTGLVHFVAKYQHDRTHQRRFLRAGQRAAMVSSLAGTVFLFGLAPWLSNEIFHKPDLAIILRVMALSIPFFALSVVGLAATRGAKTMRYTVYVRKMLVPGMQVVGSVAAFVLGFLALGLPVSYIVAIIAGFVVVLIGQHRVFGSDIQHIKATSVLRTLLGFSLPLMLAQGLTVMAGRLDTLVLGRFVNADQVGLYSVVLQISLVIALVLLAFTTMFAPMAAELWHKGQRERLSRLYKTVTRWVFTVSLGLTGLIILFRTEILRLFGPRFVSMSSILVLVALGRLIHTSTGPSGSLIIMAGYSKLGLFNGLLQVVTNMLLLLWLVPAYGLVGAGITLVVQLCVVNVAYVLEVAVLLRMHPYERAFLKPIAAMTLATGVVWLFQRSVVLSEPMFRVLISGGLFLGIFVGILYLSGLEDTELTLLKIAKQRLTGKYG